MLADVDLRDKFNRQDGRVFITGTQALVRVLLDQARADAAAGFNTGGFVSGYRGSPLGALDTALWQARDELAAGGIVFQPGLNEELAATSVYGSQQVGFFDRARRDGVFAAWYGKGPGVDRAGDALKHGNLAGTAARGGVLVFAGDDHAAKSSTTAHQSEQALSAALIPVLYPGSVEDFLAFGSFGYALSRFSGLWVGFKCVNDTADGTATAGVADAAHRWSVPHDFVLPPEGLNIIRGERQLDQERRTVELRLPAAQAFARANGIDRVVRNARERTLGIVTAGKAAFDVLEALESLGLNSERCSALGIRVLKLGLTWPADPATLREFASGHRQLLVVEEKRAFMEPQLASALYALPGDLRPSIIGKSDEAGLPLITSIGELSPPQVERALMRVLIPLGLKDAELEARWAEREAQLSSLSAPASEFARMPFFCSGCPHNRSTTVPEGSVALSGIGCHVMAAFMPHRPHVWPVQMGGEGANWIGVAPFTGTGHVFQNLGDGTYNHSGSLAIRAAVAAGVNITYKLLFNDAVAMTGGQPVEGRLTPWQIATELLQEGVRRVTVVADDPGKYPAGTAFPAAVPILHRDQLEQVQRELSQVPGVTVIIYDQMCAAEKRRGRKRGRIPDPPARVFINDLVCEGCGDCSAKSNCVSIQPLETEFGRKRRIDQSSCNKDFSCVGGFCPSFVTVEGGEIAAARRAPGAGMPDLPEPPAPAAPVADAASILVTGIGGTGVVTIGALLGMAAHLEGKSASIVDMTGLSQKNGAVFSHVRISAEMEMNSAARIPVASADLLLACDMLSAGSAEAMSLVNPRTTVGIVNDDLVPTAAFTIDTRVDFKAAQTAKRLRAALDGNRSLFLPATRLAESAFGDSIGANLVVIGAALQNGLLPLSVDALTRAIQLNGVAVEGNLAALRLGRLLAANPENARALLPESDPSPQSGSAWLSETLDEFIARRAEYLVGYQNDAYAETYLAEVAAIREAEERVLPGNGELTRAAAAGLFKAMAYKDEYEVARLYASEDFRAKLSRQFTGDLRLRFHLAPSILARRDPVTGQSRKVALGGYMMTVFRILARLKGLRGTMFDVFGYSTDRREERRFLREYRSLLRQVADGLRPDNHAAAVRLAALPDEVRGFGHVKERGLRQAETRKVELLEEFSVGSEAFQDAA